MYPEWYIFTAKGSRLLSKSERAWLTSPGVRINIRLNIQAAQRCLFKGLLVVFLVGAIRNSEKLMSKWGYLTCMHYAVSDTFGKEIHNNGNISIMELRLYTAISYLKKWKNMLLMNRFCRLLYSYGYRLTLPQTTLHSGEIIWQLEMVFNGISILV